MKMWKISKKHTNDFSIYREQVDLWNTLLNKEKDRSNINFDLENNDAVDDSKVMDLDITRGEESFRVLYQRCQAGGDWESPISYFKCQIESKYKDGKFNPDWKCIFIPVKGNKNLIKSKKPGAYVAIDADSCIKYEPSDIKLMVEELRKEIPKRIKRYYSSLDYDKGDVDQFKECGLVRDLLTFWNRK